MFRVKNGIQQIAVSEHIFDLSMFRYEKVCRCRPWAPRFLKALATISATSPIAAIASGNAGPHKA